MATRIVPIFGHSLAAYLWDFGTNAGHATYGTRARRSVFGGPFTDASLDGQGGESAPNSHFGCHGIVNLIDQFIENETSSGVDQFLFPMFWSGGLGPDGWISAWDSTWSGQLTSAGITDFEAAYVQAYIPYNVNADVSGFAAKLDTIHNRLLSFTGRSASNFKFIVPLDGNFPDGLDASSVAIRAALYAKSLTTGCYFGGSQIDIPNGSDQHYTQPAGATRAGKRIGHCLGYAFGYESVSPYGPDISGAYWVPGTNKIYVQVRHRGGATLLNGLGSGSATITNSDIHFKVTASGGQTITTQALVSGAIEITMSAVRGTGETVSLTYMAKNYLGNSHVNDNDIFDDRSDVLGDTIGRPLLPTFDVVSVKENLGIAVFNHHFKQQMVA